MKRIGSKTMSDEAYEEFTKLSKEKQVESLLKTMSPKNEELAKELLKDVPNGDISSRNDKKDSTGKAADSSNVGKDNTKKS